MIPDLRIPYSRQNTGEGKEVLTSGESCSNGTNDFKKKLNSYGYVLLDNDTIEAFVFNANLAFLYNIDIEGFKNVLANDKLAPSGN